MPIHKKILGGEEYLPFALNKLRQLAADAKQRGGYASRIWNVDDGTKIILEVAGDQQFVTITGGGPGYEFFTSEHIPSLAPLVIQGSGLRWDKGKAKPLFSNPLTPTPDGPQWWVPADPTLNYDTTAADTIVDSPRFFSTWATWQQSKGREYVWWPANGSDSLVTSTTSLFGGTLNQAGWFGLAGPPSVYASFSDVGFDVPPAYYDKKGAQVGAPQLETDVWWRRAAVQRVTHPTLGTRDFFIMTDTHGRFHVYPVKPYQKTRPGLQYVVVPPGSFKTASPPYPAWVTLPTIGTAISANEFVWTFNKDATKAVSIPFNSVAGELWIATFTAVDGVSTASYTKQPFYKSLVAPFETTLTAGANTRGGKDDTPGLFEVNIGITLTGVGDMDFDITLTAGVTDYYGDDAIPGSSRYYVDAGYLLKNKRLGKNAETVLGAVEDALLTAEIEMWGAPSRIARIGEPYTVDDTHPPKEHMYEPGTQDAGTGFYASDNLSAYYVVREYTTQKEIKRIPLSSHCGWNSSGPGGHFVFAAPGNTSMTTVQYADLRSLSFSLVKFKQVTGLVSGRSVEYHTANRLAAGPVGRMSINGNPTIPDTALASYLPSSAATPVATDTLAKIPNDSRDVDAARMLMQGAALAFVGGALIASGINVHPEGHWACGGAANEDTEGVLDIIQAYGKDGAAKARTSHKAQFNKAFGQARDYSFYGAGNDTEDDGGGFQTYGVWKTF